MFLLKKLLILIDLMRILELNNEKKFKSIRKLFTRSKKTVTYKEGIEHLLKMTSRLLDI